MAEIVRKPLDLSPADIAEFKETDSEMIAWDFHEGTDFISAGVGVTKYLDEVGRAYFVTTDYADGFAVFATLAEAREEAVEFANTGESCDGASDPRINATTLHPNYQGRIA